MHPKPVNFLKKSDSAEVLSFVFKAFYKEQNL